MGIHSSYVVAVPLSLHQYETLSLSLSWLWPLPDQTFWRKRNPTLLFSLPTWMLTPMVPTNSTSKLMMVLNDQEGSLKQITEEAAGAVSSGSYSYTDPDGNVVSLSFVADENGFQPTGDHLPKPHPAIVRALEQIRRTNEADAKRAAGHHHHA